MQKIKYILLLVIATLLSLSYHPYIITLGGDDIQRGTVLTPIITGLFLILFVLSLGEKPPTKDSFFRIAIISLLATLLVGLLIEAVFNVNSMLVGDLRALFISLGACYIGYQQRLSRKQYVVLLVVFSVTSCYAGLMQVLVNGSGFAITEYFAWQKNSLGGLIATSIVLSFTLLTSPDSKWQWRVLYLALFVLGAAVILTIRARTATIAALLCVVLSFYFVHKGKHLGKSVILAFLLLFTLSILLPDSVGTYVTDSFTSGYGGGDITSGRTERNIAVLDFLRDNLFLGALGANQNLLVAHNFPLYKLYQYGIIFSFPVMFLYVYILCFSLKKIASVKEYESISALGIVTIFVPYIISMGEYTFPFGPGTATVINFILLGCSLRVVSDKNCN